MMLFPHKCHNIYPKLFLNKHIFWFCVEKRVGASGVADWVLSTPKDLTPEPPLEATNQL